MTQDDLNEELKDLKEVYQDIAVGKGSAGQDLIRIKKVALPKGCSPATTPVLLMLQNGQARPQIYVKPGIKLPGGQEPRSTTPVQVEGEGWLQFSYNFPWDENNNTLLQFIEAALRRFSKN
jgi:hypothetical protein